MTVLRSQLFLIQGYGNAIGVKNTSFQANRFSVQEDPVCRYTINTGRRSVNFQSYGTKSESILNRKGF